ncbi:conserved hypothetical protein [Desulfosarcina cetonica]|nr:conserved hypothetical protein [Desulfosarcina cetonica]
MSVPVAMIPYTNMAPYRQLGTPDGCHFVPLVPRQSIAALMAGEVVAAAVPVGGLFQLSQRVEMLGRFGIAAKGPCMSVMLFSRVPFETLRAPKTVRITRETASSVRLLHLLLANTVGLDHLPLQVGKDDRADAELLIGDRALVRGQRPVADDFPHVIDLADKWFDMQGLPFVFARWVVRTDAADGVKQALGDWLGRFREREPLLVEKAVEPSAAAVGVAPEVIRRYFQVIRRSLDDTDIQGQARFVQLLEQWGPEPAFPPSGA